MGSMIEEFEKFLKQGNLVQLAIAFVIGAAFATLIQSLVADVFTPLIGVFGHFNFSSWQFSVNGSVFQIGVFLNAVISFTIVALVVFFVIALPYQRYMDRKAAQAPKLAPNTRECPQCLTQIPIKAKKCFACGSRVKPIRH